MTLLLYLTDVSVGGETVLPLTDGGMAGRGCSGCALGNGPDAALADKRAAGCYRCARRTEAELLADCPAAAAGGGPGGDADGAATVVSPAVGRLVLWHNYHTNGSWNPAAIHAGESVGSVRALEQRVTKSFPALDQRAAPNSTACLNDSM